jgi:cell division septation protein DedD
MAVTVQMKQRIIGIVVLVFLGLIILPWMFEQNPPDVFTNHAKSPASLPEVVKEPHPATAPIPDPMAASEPVSAPQPLSDVYTTDQEDSAAASLSNQHATAIEEPVPASTSATITAKSVPMMATRPEPSDLDSSKIAKIEDGIIKTKSVTKTPEPDVIVAKPAPKVKIVAELKKPNMAKLKLAVAKNEASKTNKKKSGRGWLIQLGSFGTKSNADKLIKQLEAKGYHVYSIASKNSQGKEITKVVVGPESDRSSAESLAAKINKVVHINGVIIKG